MKVYNGKNKRIWYDTYLKMWTLQTIDDAGNQISDVEYTCDKKVAFEWVKQS